MSPPQPPKRRRSIGSAETYRALLEFAPDAIVVIDPSGEIVLVNAQTEALFGYLRDELLGKPVEILLPESLHGRHAMHRGVYLADPRARPMGANLTLAGQRKDGKEFPVDISLAPLQTAEGLLVAAAIRDVTERKRLETFRDEFIRNAAHELRTPMATLAGLGETLADHFDELRRDQIEQILAALKRQGERAGSLITTLLDLSRLESGTGEIESAALSVRTIIDQALAVAPPPPRIKLDLVPPADLWVTANAVRVDQVMNNLLTNAYRYGGDAVTVSAHATGPWVEIEVSDDGEGVPEQLEDHLFEPFARGPDSGLHGGSGVGLALTKRIVEAQQGTIRYERGTPGARFIVALRRAQPPSA